MHIICKNKLGVVWYHQLHRGATLAFISGVLADLRSKMPDVEYTTSFDTR